MGVLYILLIALINLCIGFALAVYAGKRYRELGAIGPARENAPWPSENHEGEYDEEPDAFVAKVQAAKSQHTHDEDVSVATDVGAAFDMDDEEDYGQAFEDEEEISAAAEVEEPSESEEAFEEGPDEAVEVEAEQDDTIPEEEAEDFFSEMDEEPGEAELAADEEEPPVAEIEAEEESPSSEPHAAAPEDHEPTPLDQPPGSRTLASASHRKAVAPALLPAWIVLEHFAPQLEEFHKTIQATDDEFRRFADDADHDAERATQLLGELHEQAEAVRTQCEQFRTTVTSLAEEQPEFVQASAGVLTSLEAHIPKLKMTKDYQRRYSSEKNRKKAAGWVLQQLAKLSGTNHGLFDAVDIGMGSMVSSAEYLSDLPEDSRRDPATGLLNREGLKAYYHEAQSEAGTDDVPMGIALIDIDRMTEINEKFGMGTGDRLIMAVARFLDEHRQERCIVGRVSGQQFFLLYPGMDSQIAMNETERLRQFLAKTVFKADGEEVQLTISALVLGKSEALRGASPKEIYDQATKMLMQGKRQSRNRTFLMQDDQSSLVTPPRYTLEDIEIDL